MELLGCINEAPMPQRLSSIVRPVLVRAYTDLGSRPAMYMHGFARRVDALLEAVTDKTGNFQLHVSTSSGEPLFVMIGADRDGRATAAASCWSRYARLVAAAVPSVAFLLPELQFFLSW